jgi:hypothetical protein
MAENFTQTYERFDVGLDAVGKSRLVRCRPLLNPAGAFLITDLAREPRPATDRRDPLGRGPPRPVAVAHQRSGARATGPRAAREQGPATGRGPHLRARRHRRCLPLRRNGTESRGRGHHRDVTRPPIPRTRTWPSRAAVSPASFRTPRRQANRTHAGRSCRSGSRGALLRPGPLRTVRATFTAPVRVGRFVVIRRCDGPRSVRRRSGVQLVLGFSRLTDVSIGLT